MHMLYILHIPVGWHTNGLHSSGSVKSHDNDTEEGMATTALNVHLGRSRRSVLMPQSKHLHSTCIPYNLVSKRMHL